MLACITAAQGESMYVMLELTSKDITISIHNIQKEMLQIFLLRV